MNEAEIENAFQMMHFGCNNDDHREAYLLLAKVLGYSGEGEN